MEPLVPGDTAEALSDLVMLCTDCSELIDGLHWLTRRTKVFFEADDEY